MSPGLPLLQAENQRCFKQVDVVDPLQIQRIMLGLWP